MTRIVALLSSPAHRYDGRPGPDAPLDTLVDSITVRAGLGIVGDRYFNRPAHRDASVTVMSLDAIAEALPDRDAGLARTRRNILLAGVRVDDALGRVLELDSGSGVVALRLHRAARPCGWLDEMIAPGTRRALRGRGGVRCEPLTDGELHLGPVTVTWRD